MEMEFKDTARRRRVMLLVVGAALAAVAGFGAFTLAGKGAPTTVVQKANVLVAARDIQARQPVSADDLKVAEVPVDQVLPQAYTEISLVVGRLTAVPIYPGQQVTPNLFATTAADTDFSILGPDEQVTATSPVWRAVSLEVPTNRAVGGEIKAGQHIDIVISVDFKVFATDDTGNYVQVDTATKDGLRSDKSTKITMQDIEVLKSDPDNNMYVLKVDLHQAEQLAHIIQLAPESIALALRPDTDTRPVDPQQYGETTDSLVMTYLFRVPRLVDLTQLLGIPTIPTVPGSPVPGASPTPGQSNAPTGSPQPSGGPGPQPTPVATSPAL